jgi:succinate dehydrogenase/fumarate reductase-like Fe-S protein
MVVKPLYNHVSMETSYLVEGYPYGRLKCRIRFWLESHPKKGFRFVSQTENPKNLQWNNPKRSTYSLLAACMYIDDKGHVQWSSVNEYSEPNKFLEFLQNFPDIILSKEEKGRLQYWVSGKIAICNTTIQGKAVISINGKPCLPSETDIENAKTHLEYWEKSKTLLLPKF